MSQILLMMSKRIDTHRALTPIIKELTKGGPIIAHTDFWLWESIMSLYHTGKLTPSSIDILLLDLANHSLEEVSQIIHGIATFSLNGFRGKSLVLANGDRPAIRRVLNPEKFDFIDSDHFSQEEVRRVLKRLFED